MRTLKNQPKRNGFIAFVTGTAIAVSLSLLLLHDANKRRTQSVWRRNCHCRKMHARIRNDITLRLYKWHRAQHHKNESNITFVDGAGVSFPNGTFPFDPLSLLADKTTYYYYYSHRRGCCCCRRWWWWTRAYLSEHADMNRIESARGAVDQHTNKHFLRS